MTGQGDGNKSEEGHEWGQAAPTSSGPPKPGDIITESGLAMAPEPLVGHDVSTPLEEDEPEHTIPSAPAVGHEGASAHPVAPPAGPRAARPDPRVPGRRRLHPLLHRRRAAPRHDRPPRRDFAQRLRVHPSRPHLPRALRGAARRGRPAGQLLRHGHRDAAVRGRRRTGHPLVHRLRRRRSTTASTTCPRTTGRARPYQHFRQDLEITAY